MRARPDVFQAYVAPAVPGRAMWRLGLGLALVAVVYVGLNSGAIGLYAALRGPEAAANLGAKLSVASTPATALLLLATFAPMLAGTVLAARLAHGRGLASLLGPRARLGRDFAAATAAIAACYLPVFAVWTLAWDSQPNLPLGLWLMLLPATLAGVALQTLAEEALFRGYLVQQLAARFASALVWAGLPALAFAGLHFDTARLGAAAPAVLVVALVFALIATDLTRRTGGLGAAWGLHFGNNAIAIAGIATGAPLSGLALRTTPYDAEELTGTPILLSADLLPMLAAWLLMRWLMRP